MFFAMAFLPSEENYVCVRNLRVKGFKTQEMAAKALERKKLKGYVKKLGNPVPVWSNVK